MRGDPAVPPRPGVREKPGQHAAPSCSRPQPSPQRWIPGCRPRGPQKGAQQGGDMERGPPGWVSSQEKQVSICPSTSQAREGPTKPAPPPGAGTHLPEPASADLLQVQEAVPAQVCGLEQLHCNRALGSGTTAQPPPSPPHPLIRPLEGLPTWPPLGSCTEPPRGEATPVGHHQEQGACHPKALWTCKFTQASFWEGLSQATGTSQAGDCGAWSWTVRCGWG